MRVFDVECGGGGGGAVGVGIGPGVAAATATGDNAAHLRHPPFRSGI